MLLYERETKFYTIMQFGYLHDQQESNYLWLVVNPVEYVKISYFIG